MRHRAPPKMLALQVAQVGSVLSLDFETRADLRAVTLGVRWLGRDQWVQVTALEPGSTSHRIRVELATLVAPGTALAAEGDTAELCVELTTPTADRTQRVPLGRAGATTSAGLRPVTVDGRELTPYLARDGVVSVAIGRPVESFGEVRVQSLRGHGGVLRLRGRIDTAAGVLVDARSQLTARSGDRRLEGPVDIVADPRRTARRHGQRWYRFSAALDWRALWDGDAEPANDIFDLWLALTFEGRAEPHRVRVGKTPFFVRKLTRPTWARRGEAAVAIEPYYTYRAHATSFRVDLFDADALRYMRRRLLTRHADRLRYTGPPIWLVGEQPVKAQDTGLAMFRYLRRNHPEIAAYYVMDTSSPEYANVAELGNVVSHRSKEHIRLSLLASRVVGSHHPEFLYPVRSARYRRAVRAVRVFLQHGVMGIKWMAPMYGKGRSDFETDLFIVSSEREKEYIVSDFGYEPDEVAVTGLPRFDTLFADDVPLRRQILIMPTWRTTLLEDAQTYLDSQYHARWSGLLHSERLRALAATYDLDLVFCLHPNMRAYTGLFADTPARVISQGAVDVQHLLKESAVLVTDFSSVGFDFAFLDKPVVFFQFDRNQVLGETGAHIDLDRELPGTAVLTEDGLLDALERICARGFTPDPEARERADRFIVARDRGHSERVFAAVQTARRRRWQPRLLIQRPLPQGVYRRWRGSRYYLPMMRWLFRAVRRLPGDSDRVVFEAGMGLQYADSPRYLYEELVRRGSTMTKVWAYQGKIHTEDPNTTVVRRLSVAYFWHLARAKYWVSSQNLPYYLTRRPDGVYVQTWHGTPLKRMLRDVAEVHGRDEGYVARMTRAAAQWSVLVSPSPFATEHICAAYGYTGAALEVGYPRNDSLLGDDREQLAAVVRSRLGIRPGTRVILYAPTFRDDQARGGNRFDFRMPFDVAAVSERLGPDTVLLLRMHILVSSQLIIPAQCTERVFDVSAYPEIQELYLASDALVTDYSSAFFDYALLRRPIVFHAYDLDDYRDRLRGFYLDYRTELPGPITTTEDELVAALDDLGGIKARYADRFDEFLARFAPHDDGHAAERVVDAIFGSRGGSGR